MSDAGLKKIKTALISVYDKTGLVPFARNLADRGIRILSTGNTARTLRDAGVPVEEVSSVTRFPEILDGRVKTLHPKIHGGILARRGNPDHVAALKKLGIQTIDLVVVQLYPFEKTVRSGASQDDAIEMIDVGGPTMLRASAKNFGDVTPLCDTADFGEFADLLDRYDNQVPYAFRRRMAAKVFATLADYDGLVADYMARLAAEPSGSEANFPERLVLAGRRSRELRYGENPHQKGAIYELKGSAQKGLLDAEVLWGKELSFNNYLDLEAAWALVSAFEEPCATVIKHNNPCGFGVDPDPARAFVKAFEGDPLSSFGGIIGFNRSVTTKAARAILKAGFFECVVAPDFAKEALSLLMTKKNLRLLKTPLRRGSGGWDCKKITGALLVQEPDHKDVLPDRFKRVSRKSVSAATAKELAIAFKLLRFIRSNAIAVFKKDRLIGAGMGLTSRVDSAELALKKAGRKAKGAVMASDGFFPKPDSIALARRHGIRAIAQPGGSIQDEAVIKACDDAGIAMVFTGVRHFSH